MDTIKIKKQNAKIIAHRGLSGIERENTNAAFVAAGNRSYYGIETDIHKTIDGEYVVMHDSCLKRVSGIDIDVESSTLAEIQSIPLYDIDGVADRIDLRPTTLANYIKICKKYDKHSVLELKGAFTESDIKEIVDIINSYEYLKSVTFISFEYNNLAILKKMLPNQAAEFLFDDITDEIIANAKRDGMNIDIYHKSLTKEKIDLLHSHGFTVNCWTVNEKECADDLIAWGVDYITTNILE